MPLTIDLTPAEEAHLASAAQQEGLAPAEFARKLVTRHITPPAVEEALLDKLRALQEQDGTRLMPTVSAQILSERATEEAARMTDKERAAEDRLWEAFQKGINETRAASGMRLL